MTNDDLILARSAPLAGYVGHHLLVKVLLGMVTLGFSASLGLLSILVLVPPDINANAPPTEFFPIGGEGLATGSVWN